MSSNLDGELGRRDNKERSWSNYHEDRQHVNYQSSEEPDKIWQKQAHRNEVLSSLRADGRMEDELGTIHN